MARLSDDEFNAWFDAVMSSRRDPRSAARSPVPGRTMSGWQRVLVRAVRSGVQSFLAVLVASGTGLVSMGVLRGAALAGLAAAVSALHNGIELAAHVDEKAPEFRG